MNKPGLWLVATICAVGTAVACWGSFQLGSYFSSFSVRPEALTWPEMFYSPAFRRLIELAVLYPLLASGLGVHLLAAAVNSTNSRALFAAAVLCTLLAAHGGVGASQVAAELRSHQLDAGFRVKTAEAFSNPVLSLITWYGAGVWLPILGFGLSCWCLWSKVISKHCLTAA